MIDFKIKTQPDDETCGPTSLHAVYRYYGDHISLRQVIQEVKYVKGGGTIASFLGIHALQRGYKATLYVYSLMLFDPTWFEKHNQEYISQKLREQMRHKTSPKFLEVSRSYIDFIELGGEIQFKDLTVGLLKHYFVRQQPILTGLSATYLYKSARERGGEKGESIYDDLRGEPCGHFVVLGGYDRRHRHIIVADPHRKNPISHDNYYRVNITRLINSIMLGVLTYDANLLVIEPE